MRIGWNASRFERPMNGVGMRPLRAVSLLMVHQWHRFLSRLRDPLARQWRGD